MVDKFSTCSLISFTYIVVHSLSSSFRLAMVSCYAQNHMEE